MFRYFCKTIQWCRYPKNADKSFFFPPLKNLHSSASHSIKHSHNIWSAHNLQTQKTTVINELSFLVLHLIWVLLVVDKQPRGAAASLPPTDAVPPLQWRRCDWMVAGCWQLGAISWPGGLTRTRIEKCHLLSQAKNQMHAGHLCTIVKAVIELLK